MTQTTPLIIAKNITVYPESNEIELREGDQITKVNLEPRVMKVLLLLAKNEGGVIPREQFIDEIWDNYESADEALTQAVSLLRKKINDTDSNDRIIETIPKKGYKLNRSVELKKSPSEVEGKSKNLSKISVNRYIWIALGIVIILLLIAVLIFYSTISEDRIAPVAPKTEIVE